MPALFRIPLIAGLSAIVGLSTSASVARADADEASIHAELTYGKATVGDAAIGDAILTIPMIGVGLRLTYSTSDWYAYEARIGYGQLLRVAEYHTGGDTDTDLRRRNWYWYRSDVGIRARLGATWIPTLSAAVGTQLRGAAVGIVQDGWASLHDDEFVLEVVASLGAGLDYRLNKTWVIGMGAGSEHGLALDGSTYQAVTVMAHVSAHWYARLDYPKHPSMQIRRRR